jgi:hypothetical protein
LAQRGKSNVVEIRRRFKPGGHPKTAPQKFQRNLRNLKLFVTTDTLDKDIAALAMIGESSQPVSG